MVISCFIIFRGFCFEMVIIIESGRLWNIPPRFSKPREGLVGIVFTIEMVISCFIIFRGFCFEMVIIIESERSWNIPPRFSRPREGQKTIVE